MKKRLIYIGLIIISGIIILIYSCSKGSNTPAPKDSGPTASVTIQNMAFGPDTLRIAAGTKVTWSNADGMTHTVTELNALFDSGNLPSGKTFSYTFSTVGSFKYYCVIHPGMKGVVIVN